MAKSPGSKPLQNVGRVDTVDPRGQLIVRPEQKPVGDGGTVPVINKDPGTQ